MENKKNSILERSTALGVTAYIAGAAGYALIARENFGRAMLNWRIMAVAGLVALIEPGIKLARIAKDNFYEMAGW